MCIYIYVQSAISNCGMMLHDIHLPHLDYHFPLVDVLLASLPYHHPNRCK